jgi:NAD(P)-dependent dehydrogenase (short-subunit alcohol dehydrogenase family)
VRDKTVLITGANSGIGLETTRVLAGMGARIVMACRDRAKADPLRDQLAGETGNDQLEVMDLDLASLADIRRFAAEFGERHGRLDVLLNNAGCFSMTRQETVDGFELTFGTNHLGPFLLTTLLLPMLRDTPAARIVNVASAAHTAAKLDWDDLQMTRRYKGFPAYANSKLANVLFTFELARRLADDDVTVNALHPGHVATNIWPSDRWYWRWSSR